MISLLELHVWDLKNRLKILTTVAVQFFSQLKELLIRYPSSRLQKRWIPPRITQVQTGRARRTSHPQQVAILGAHSVPREKAHLLVDPVADGVLARASRPPFAAALTVAAAELPLEAQCHAY